MSADRPDRAARLARDETLMSIMKLSPRFGLVAALASAAACAPLSSRPAARLAPSRLLPIDVAFKAHWPALRMAPAPIVADRSVGTSGIMGETVNEVVPIPGTDMVRAGAVPEGSLFQNSFRSPTADAAGRAGTAPTQATIIFFIDRP